MKSLNDLKIQLYADGADKAGILDLYAKPYIKGLTTNPSLMKKAGIRDYEAFAKEILQTVTAKPISFEVFTDDFTDMKRQALKITAFAKNVYTKIPITNSRGESSLPLIKELAKQGVKLNITAILTLRQVAGVAEALDPKVPSLVSVFAGRIADTGADPVPLMRACGALLQGHDRRSSTGPARARSSTSSRPRRAAAPSSRSLTTSSPRRPSSSAWISPSSRSTRSRCSPRTRPTAASPSDRPTSSFTCRADSCKFEGSPSKLCPLGFAC